MTWLFGILAGLLVLAIVGLGPHLAHAWRPEKRVAQLLHREPAPAGDHQRWRDKLFTSHHPRDL